jgi:hypothetical protein
MMAPFCRHVTPTRRGTNQFTPVHLPPPVRSRSPRLSPRPVLVSPAPPSPLLLVRLFTLVHYRFAC